MPTQQQIEWYRKKYQQITPFKLKAAWFISLVSNITTAPLEMLKVRAQLLQEGRKLHGFGTERGAPTMRIFTEIIDSGAGIRSLFTGLDSLIMRSFWYGGWRACNYSYFYNFFNPDPRRQPHWTMFSLSGFLGGFTAGVMSNPIEIVYNRQAADGLLPDHLKRNYANFFDGLLKVNHERVLFRGAVATGCAFGLLNASMSGIYDYLKEYLYYFFGPPAWLRPLCLLPTAAFGAACYLPFDNIKVRLHTMRPLPNGQLPYLGTIDALRKILIYECHPNQYSSEAALLTGMVPTFCKIYSILLMGVYISDFVFANNYLEGELWEGHTVYSGPELINIRHDPINNFLINHEYLSDEAMKPDKKIALDKKNPNTYVQI